MSPWRTSQASIPSRHSRRWPLRLLLAVFIAAVALAAAGPSRADGPVTVRAQEQTVSFSSAIDFSLEARADREITEAILFYGRVGEPIVRRIYPEMNPGTAVDLAYTEELEQGQFAPGTLFRVWWRLILDDGTVYQTEPVQFVYTDDRFDWQLMAGERVDLYWYGKGERRAETLLGVADEAIAHLEEEIGVAVAQRASVYVYNSQPDMALALSLRSEGYDDRVLTLGVAVDDHTLLLLGSHADVERTAAHELSHIVVGLATENPYTDLPRWLDEGLAMYAEGQLPEGNAQALEQAIAADALLSIRSLSSYSGQADEVDLFYAEAYSIVEYILDTDGREQMRELLAVFAEGTLQEDALRQVFGFGLDELDNRWRDSLGLAPRPTTTPAGSSAGAAPVFEAARWRPGA